MPFRVSHDSITVALGRSGLVLPEPTLRALRKRGIYTESFLSIEYRQGTREYLLRATESGGAVADMGRYCAFLHPSGEALPWLQPIDSITVNGRHAIVLAPEIVRIDMLRIQRTYELIITGHRLAAVPGQTRPRIESRTLFHGREGTLALELWKPANKDLRFHIAPVFYTPSGDERPLPQAFEQAIRVVTGAVSCVGCTHSHIAMPPTPPPFSAP